MALSRMQKMLTFDRLVPTEPLKVFVGNPLETPIAQATPTPRQSTTAASPTELLQEEFTQKLPGYGTVLIPLLLVLAWTKLRKRNSKILGKGGLGNESVLKRARKKGLQEIGTTLNKTCLYIGDPEFANSIFLRDALPGLVVEGGPNSGKSYSVFNEVTLSIIRQQFGCLIVDFKYPKQTARIVDYAKSVMGYQVGVIAPTFPETQVLNPVQLLKDHHDTLRAEEFIRVAKANFSKGAKQSSSDQFWDDMATQVLTGLFCLVRPTQYPDMLMIKAIMSLEDLPARLKYAKHNIPPTVYRLFDQLFSAEGSSRQYAGLKSSILQPLDAMTNSAFLSSVCGDTTAPLDIGPGQMLILGVNRNYKKTLIPLIGALIHTTVERNINEQRETPFAFICDELPGIYLPDIPKWLAEGREDGFLGVLGIQAHSQMVETYGKEPTETIYTSLPTKVLMNPNNPQRAEGMAKWGGKIDVEFDTKGDGSSKQGKSRNYTGHLQSIDAVQASEITRLTQGEAIFVSPGFEDGRGKQAFIPVKKKIVVPQKHRRIIETCETLWESHVKPELIAENEARAYGDEEMQARLDCAEELLPLPPEEEDGEADENLFVENSREEADQDPNARNDTDPFDDKSEDTPESVANAAIKRLRERQADRPQ